MREELAAHGAGLDGLPEMVVLSKRDLVPDERPTRRVARWREPLGDRRARRGRRLVGDRRRASTSSARRSSRPSRSRARGARRRAARTAGRLRGRAPRLHARAATTASPSSASTTAVSRRGPRHRAAREPSRPLQRRGARLRRAAPAPRSASSSALRTQGFEPGDEVRIGEHGVRARPGLAWPIRRGEPACGTSRRRGRYHCAWAVGGDFGCALALARVRLGARRRRSPRRSLEPIGTFAAPVYVTSDPDDADRLYVVEQDGRIRLVTPSGEHDLFLDLDAERSVARGSRAAVTSRACSRSPSRPTSRRLRRFYVSYTGTAPATSTSPR